MIRFILITVAGVILLWLVVGWSLARSFPPMPRRRNGRCAVPGCGQVAGHWIARKQ